MKDLACGVSVGEIAHAGRHAVGEHGHGRPFLCLLLSGSYEERLGRRRIAYEPLTAVYHPAGVSHRETVGPRGARLFGARLGPAFLRRLDPEPVPRGVVVASPDGDLVWLMRRLHQEWSRPDGCSALAAEGLLLEMLVATGRAATRRAPAESARRARELLSDRFAEGLTLAEVAREIGERPSTLATAFRRAHGCSLADYQRRLRVDAACREIARGRTLTDVAAVTGFADQSHLTRVFKRIAGVTPAALRRRGLR